MALVISAVEVTGTAIAYTVPVGKVAKVRLVSIINFSNGANINIGNYQITNASATAVWSYSQGQNSSGSSTSFGLPVSGFVRASANGASMATTFLYIKEDHILVAGETVRVNDTLATFAYTIFEEDA
jgi:hypothetical protein